MQHARLLGILLGLLLLGSGGILGLLNDKESRVSPDIIPALPASINADIHIQETVEELEDVQPIGEVEEEVVQPQIVQEQVITPAPFIQEVLVLESEDITEEVLETDSDILEPLPPPVPAPVGKININTAQLEELDLIPGVGPAIAQRIIDYRTNIRLFYFIEDIKEVKGIGEITFEKMKNEITVGDVVPVVQPSPAPLPSSEPAPSLQQGRIFYTSSYHSAKYYYCDTDSAWEALSPKYLESYPSEQDVLAQYPEKTLHEPCE